MTQNMISKFPLASRICVLIFSTNKANHMKVEAYMAFPKRPKTTTTQHNITGKKTHPMIENNPTIYLII